MNLRLWLKCWIAEQLNVHNFITVWIAELPELPKLLNSLNGWNWQIAEIAEIIEFHACWQFRPLRADVGEHLWLLAAACNSFCTCLQFPANYSGVFRSYKSCICLRVLIVSQLSPSFKVCTILQLMITLTGSGSLLIARSVSLLGCFACDCSSSLDQELCCKSKCAE